MLTATNALTNAARGHAAVWLAAGWQTAREGERLTVRAVRARLCHGDVAMAARRLVTSGFARGVREVVFDLARVESFGPQWTLVLAEFIHFSRAAGVACRVESLHGQPAAAVSLYGKNREVRALLAGMGRAA